MQPTFRPFVNPEIAERCLSLVGPTNHPLGDLGALVAVPDLSVQLSDMQILSHQARVSGGRTRAEIGYKTSDDPARAEAELSALANSLGATRWQDEQHPNSNRVTRRRVEIENASFGDGRRGEFQASVANRSRGCHVTMMFAWDSDEALQGPIANWLTSDAPLPPDGTPYRASYFAYYTGPGHRVVDFHYIYGYDLTTEALRTAIAATVESSVYDRHDPTDTAGVLGYLGMKAGEIRPCEIPEGRSGVELTCYSDAFHPPVRL